VPEEWETKDCFLPEREITDSVGYMGRIHFKLAKTEKEEGLWRYLIQTYR